MRQDFAAIVTDWRERAARYLTLCGNVAFTPARVVNGALEVGGSAASGSRSGGGNKLPRRFVAGDRVVV
ncbi:unnamed protein product [Phaeothamnion confervicola]